jgi:two-component sensor histidine kinase
MEGRRMPDPARWPHVLTLEEQCLRAGGISREEIEHFHALVAVWQLLADLCFADMLLLAPIQGDPDGNLLVLAQIRPDTAQTLYQDDHVGTALLREHAPQAVVALATGRPQTGPKDARGVERSAVPVLGPVGRFAGVLLREGRPFGGRNVSDLEQAYERCAEEIFGMVIQGVFPFAGMADWDSPRPSDGLMVIGPDGQIEFASPNAVAAHRRLGVVGPHAGHVRELPGGQAILSAMGAGVPQQGEVEVGGSVVGRRFVPFCASGESTGGLLLVQDVTEVRRRDRMVMYKDAVIREINHRVKNNLQTMASLLRLQARRLDSHEGRAALEESVRRISAFALVHEALSETSSDRVDFADVLRGILRMLEDALALGERGVTTSMTGSIGELPAAIATPLALVLTELVQNAAEHAFVGRERGHIEVSIKAEDVSARATVRDDGIGYSGPGAFVDAGLGLQIVAALVEHDLKGSIKVESDGGATFEVVIPLPLLAP